MKACIGKIAKKAHTQEEGLTLIEVLTALMAFGILLAILGTALGGYLAIYGSSEGLSNEQSSLQQLITSIRGILSNITPCPGATSGFISTPANITTSNSFKFSAVIPSSSTATTSSNYSPVEVVTISDSNGTLAANAQPCPTKTGPGNIQLFTVGNYQSSSLSYTLLPSPWTWPYPTSNNPSSSQYPSIVGINLSLTFKSGSGTPITVSTSVAITAYTCDQPTPPSTAPGTCL